MASSAEKGLGNFLATPLSRQLQMSW